MHKGEGHPSPFPFSMRKFLLVILPLCLLLSGLALLLYPTVSSAVNRRHSSQAIQSFTQQVQQAPDTHLQQQFALAEAYNQRLIGKAPDLSGTASADYFAILDFDGGMMGYLSIPALDLNLPIYHGTGTVALKSGVGHLPQSAFPIGGAGTHSVLVGHTGLPQAKLFTDLYKLCPGDAFSITVGDQTATYTVDQIKTVLPFETDALRADPERDFCTLVTCTPYGVNSHRLLVRGTRTDTQSGYAPLPTAGEFFFSLHPARFSCMIEATRIPKEAFSHDPRTGTRSLFPVPTIFPCHRR